MVRHISTAERNDINKDPAVQEVMTLFGGELTNITRDAAGPMGVAEPDEDEDS